MVQITGPAAAQQFYSGFSSDQVSGPTHISKFALAANGLRYVR